jgi:NIMA (never in mitosis gene a)-related kinase
MHNLLLTRVREAITKREELRLVVMKHEEEVAIAMARRGRSDERRGSWRLGRRGRSRQGRNGREEELEAERLRLNGVRVELETQSRMKY